MKLTITVFFILAKKELLKMKLIALCILTLGLSSISYGGCQGCCSGHGGVVCENRVSTKCRDGKPLSKKCRDKQCNKCLNMPPLKTELPVNLASKSSETESNRPFVNNNIYLTIGNSENSNNYKSNNHLNSDNKASLVSGDNTLQ